MNSSGALRRFFPSADTKVVAPLGGLTRGKGGNFYGPTAQCGSNFSGTVYRFSTNGTLSTLVSLGGTNGGSPHGQLVAGPDGSLYGTTTIQGSNNAGTVFRITTNGVFPR